MTLTVRQIEAAKPRKRKYLLPDGAGLYLQILPSGTKSFIYRYRRPITRKENIFTYGRYPELTLREARELHQDARKLLSQGIDPGEEKKKAKDKGLPEELSFEAIAQEWLERFSPSWSAKNLEVVKGRLSRYVFPFIGQKRICDLTPADLLAVIKRIEACGVLETARRVRGLCSQIFRYAISTGRADRDPAADLKGVLPPTNRTKKHLPALTDPKDVGQLMRAMESYSGHYVVKCALRIGIYTFLRSREIREAPWSEIDLERREWRIPATRMKMNAPHIVPLSRQAVSVLAELYEVTQHSPYAFHGCWKRTQPLSENTLNYALKRMGYGERLVFHGLRGTAATLLYERGWPSEAVERQLAHAERNQVRAAYDHALYLEKRKAMMQYWADYLDSLRDGRKMPSYSVTGK